MNFRIILILILFVSTKTSIAMNDKIILFNCYREKNKSELIKQTTIAMNDKIILFNCYREKNKSGAIKQTTISFNDNKNMNHTFVKSQYKMGKRIQLLTSYNVKMSGIKVCSKEVKDLLYKAYQEFQTHQKQKINLRFNTEEKTWDIAGAESETQ